MRLAFLALVAMGCGGAVRHIPPPSLPQAPAQAHRSPPPKALQHYALAVVAWQEGDLPQAREHIGVALLFDPNAAWLHLAHGRIALEGGDLGAARVGLERAVQLDPHSTEARLALARVLEIQGERQAAAGQLEALLADQRHDRAFADLAQLQLLLGQREQAAAVLARWLEAPPEHHSWLERRGSLLLELDRPFEAWEDLARLLEGGGASGPAVDLLMAATHRCRRYGSTLELLESVVQWEPGNEDMVVRLGGLAEKAGDHRRAVDAWAQLDMLRGGADASVKLMLAQASLADRQASRALDAIAAARALNPDQPTLDEFHARALFASGKQQAALDLIASWPGWREDINLLLLRGDLLEQAGRDVEARDSLRQALQAGPPSWILAQALAPLEARTGGLDTALELAEQHPDPLADDAQRLLFQAQLLRQAGQSDRALAMLEEIEGRWPQAVEPARSRVAWLREDGQTSCALDASRQAVERMPVQPSLVQQLALIEIEAGAPDRALALLRSALVAHPDHPHLLNDLAYLEVQAGDHGDEVLAMARRAVDQKPASGAFADTLGWVLLVRGERAQAVAMLERAARLSPDDPVVARHLAMALADGAAGSHETR